MIKLGLFVVTFKVFVGYLAIYDFHPIRSEFVLLFELIVLIGIVSFGSSYVLCWFFVNTNFNADICKIPLPNTKLVYSSKSLS